MTGAQPADTGQPVVETRNDSAGYGPVTKAGPWSTATQVNTGNSRRNEKLAFAENLSTKSSLVT